MGFRRFGRRRQVDVLGEIHQRLSSLETEMRTAVVEVRSAVEERVRTAVQALEQARDSGMEQLTDALRQVARSYELLAERIEADRLERRSLADAIAAVAPAALPRPAWRVIGGTISGRDSTPDDATPRLPRRETTIDLAGEERRGGSRHEAIEVRCRFGDRWADGFEVVDVVDDGTSVRYRVRRTSDGTILPTLFDATDVRGAETSPRDEGARPARGHWSRPGPRA